MLSVAVERYDSVEERTMGQSIIVNLLINAALLLALSVIYETTLPSAQISPLAADIDRCTDLSNMFCHHVDALYTETGGCV